MTKHFTNAVSQRFGRFAEHEFPGWFQRLVNVGYVKLMRVDMREFEAPQTYRSLNALFTRHLKQMRPFSADAAALISPSDSFVTAQGQVTEDLALQIKGLHYSVGELLGNHIDLAAKEALEGGSYINLYLSPSDYHRYHIPTDLQVLRAVHIPGRLYPVNFGSLRKRLNLFLENERVVIECLTRQEKRLFIVLIGALNVGKMQVSFAPRLKTNADSRETTCYAFDNLFLDKGEDFGCFEMGSTIVLLAEKGAMKSRAETGQKVRFGDTIAELLL